MNTWKGEQPKSAAASICALARGGVGDGVDEGVEVIAVDHLVAVGYAELCCLGIVGVAVALACGVIGEEYDLILLVGHELDAYFLSETVGECVGDDAVEHILAVLKYGIVELVRICTVVETGSGFIGEPDAETGCAVILLHVDWLIACTGGKSGYSTESQHGIKNFLHACRVRLMIIIEMF